MIDTTREIKLQEELEKTLFFMRKQLLTDVSLDLYGEGEYRSDSVVNVAAHQAITGESKSPEEVEEVVSELLPGTLEHERYVDNWQAFHNIQHSLTLMGGLPCQVSNSQLDKEIEQRYSQEPKRLMERFSDYVKRNKKWITLGFAGLALGYSFRDQIKNTVIDVIDDDLDDDGYKNKYERAAGSDLRNPNSMPGDINANKIPDEWEMQNYGRLLNEGEEFTDADRDLKTVIEEYKFGTDPARFEENVKYRLIELGHSEKQAQQAFDQILELAGDPNYLQEGARAYSSHLVGLKPYELNTLMKRLGKGEHIAKGNWDRDSNNNIIEALDRDTKTNMFDPTDLHEELSEESVDFVDGLVEYNDKENPETPLPDIYGKGNLAKSIDIVEENPDIPEGFTPGEYHAMAYIPKYLPELLTYEWLIRSGAWQINKAVYEENLHRVNGEEYAWSKFVNPAIVHILELQSEGKIDLSGLTTEEAAQVLLPKELTMEKIKDGEWIAGRSMATPQKRLQFGVENVTPDEDLGGMSPQEWLRYNALPDHQDKDSLAYKESMRYLMSHRPGIAWPNSDMAFLSAINKDIPSLLPRDESHKDWEAIFDLIKNGNIEDLTLFIIGYPEYLHAYAIIPELHGQNDPYYSVLVGREFGRPTYVIDSDYPNSTSDIPFSHDEPHVRLPNGEYFGFWSDKEAYLKDFNNSIIEPYISQIYVGNDRWIPFKLDE